MHYDNLGKINSQIIGQGIAYTAGEEYHITSTDPKLQKILDEKQDELRNLIDSPESMIKLLKSEKLSTFVKKGKQGYETLAVTLEQARKSSWEYDMKIL